MDLVTIIIPYFQKKYFIHKAISSVLNQTYKNIEIVIIYDDENKSDLILLKELSKNDKRIKILVNNKNIGPGLSRNKGMKFAKGKYIAFIDSDDEWKKNKLEAQLKIMKTKNYSISHTSYEIIDKSNLLLGKRIARTFFNTGDLIKSCDIGLSTVVLEKKIINKHIAFPNLRTKEDFVLWLKILEKRYVIGSIKTKLSRWRKLDNSLSSNVLQKLIDGYKVYFVYMNFNFFKSIYYLLLLSLNYIRKLN
jgi:teichuronic acid biosynthesis glycosyltransferase TuaG